LSPPQHKTIHPKGMEVVANVIETCDKEAGQKLLLKGSHVHMDIWMNRLKDLEKMQGEKCRFYFKWYVLLFYLTYHPFFEAGYSVSPNTEV